MSINHDKQKLSTVPDYITWKIKFAQAKELRDRIEAGNFKEMDINPSSDEGFDQARTSMSEWLI